MLPYNAPNALKGFDLGWNYLTAKGANDPTAEDDGASTPDQGGEVPTMRWLMPYRKASAIVFRLFCSMKCLLPAKSSFPKKRQMVGRWKRSSQMIPQIQPFPSCGRIGPALIFLPFRSSIRMALPFRASLKISFHMACGESMAIDSIYDFVSDGEKSDWLLLSELAFMSPKGFPTE